MSTKAPTKLDDLLDGVRLQWEDYIVIAAYFIIVMGVGLWSSCKNRGSTKGYFLAGRSMHWIPVGASLFASNIGSGHFVGLAGSGASTGIGVAIFELSAVYVLLLLAWVFLPVYISSGVFTMPEYLTKRFGGQRLRVYTSVLSLLLYIFTKISADLLSGSVFIKQAAGLDIYPSAAFLLVLAMLFTVAGGLTAVIWTDFAQTCIMLIGAAVLAIISFVEVMKTETGFASMYESIANLFFAAQSSHSLTQNNTCGQLPDYALQYMRPATLVNDDLPWTGVVFGITLSGIWYWCTDQVIVQRALAAKNMSHARAGSIFAGYLKFTPLWLLVMPGMACRILFPDVVGCSTGEECKLACGVEGGCTNQAYPLLVLKLMPTAAKGLMIAVMLSALMSSLTSIFNSSGTLFTMDIWRRVRKNASEMELLVVGRVSVVVIVGVSVAWLPVVNSFPELFHYIQQVTSFLTPPLCAVYILAISWKRINEQGAFWGLMAGLVVGVIRFVLQYLVYPPPPKCGSTETSNIPDVVGKVHYLHFGCILFLVTAIVVIVVSLITKPINPKKLIRMTYMSRNEPGERLEQTADDNLPEHLEMFQENGFQSTDSLATSKAQLASGEDKDEANVGNTEQKLPWYRVAVNWICGIEKQAEVDISAEEMAQLEKEQLDIDEKPLWRKVNAVNAIVALVATTFLWGFFA